MAQTSKFCPTCNRQTLWARPATNHILHLLLTVFLCFTWLPIWILASIKIGGWRCQGCGYGGSFASRFVMPVIGVVLMLVGFRMVSTMIGTESKKPVPTPTVTNPASAKPETPTVTKPASAKPETGKILVDLGLVDENQLASMLEKQSNRVVEPPEIFVATRDLVCATDPKFLDSSALVAPARFLRVEAGTKLVRVGFGGMFSKLYWELSAGSSQRIYVYKDDFNRNFELVPAAPVPKATGSEKIDGKIVDGFNDYYVEIAHDDEIVLCKVTFRKLPPTADIARSVVRSAMLATVEKYPNKEIIGVALNINGVYLADEQYGGSMSYKPSDNKILSLKLRERNNLKTTEPDLPAITPEPMPTPKPKPATPEKTTRKWTSADGKFSTDAEFGGLYWRQGHAAQDRWHNNQGRSGQAIRR